MHNIYAIREISTGYYLPLGRHRQTTSDPVPWDDKHLPRFFRSRRAVNAALSAWARGVWTRETGSTGYYGGYEPPDEYDYYAPKDCGRNKQDMEVVEFSVKEV